MKPIRLSGILGYSAITLWFLLTIMMPLKAHAQTPVTIIASDIVPTIEAALTDKGITSDAVIHLDKPDQQILVAAGSSPVFDSVSVNPTSGRFLIRARGAENTPSFAISGRALVTVSYPVLANPAHRGDIIKQSDIAFIERDDLSAALYIADVSEIVGKEARRPLRAGTPLRSNDVQLPMMVKKGALVTVHFAMEGLRLSHHGVATVSGAIGDIISIENTKSDRTIKAVVTGKNRADVVGSQNTTLASTEL